MSMLTRRDLFRTMLVAGLGATGLASLTSCGDSSGTAGAVGLAASDVRRAPGALQELPAVVAAVQAFTADLYAAAAAAGTDNLVLSPYSVAIALAMTRNGALGRTGREMDDVLHAPGIDSLNGGMNELTRRIESRAREHELPDGETAEVAMSVASSLWGQQDLAWEQEFLDVLAREYGAGMRLVDYVGDAENARGLINAWTADRTGDKIPELVPEGVLDNLTRLVLVNAIHFKAPWDTPFEGERTVAFHLADRTQTEIEMVSQHLSGAGYAQGDGWAAVQVPYLGRELAMTVVLADDLAALEDRLDGELLAALTTMHQPAAGGVNLTMPRWDFRTRLDLSTLLSELGMPTAFDAEAAELEGMTTAEADLHLTHVLHEATITVDEDGTEAAAATGVVVGVTSAPPEPPAEVVLDRPFLFVVHDVETGTPLFVGRVTDPR
jgi:serpin B